MRAIILNATMKPSPAASSTEALSRVLGTEFERAGIDWEIIRLVDHDIRPGVTSDEGAGDAWPGIHRKLLGAEILVMATPTWMGQASSLCQRALERMDGMLGETADDGRPVAYGKVAGVVVTGNEDGAHHIVGTTAQALIDIGYTIPGHGWTYWHLGPGPGPDYVETDQGHDYADRVGRNAARNLMAAARALAAVPLPVPEQAG
jgi:multimeric flavodoxin WrbA